MPQPGHVCKVLCCHSENLQTMKPHMQGTSPVSRQAVNLQQEGCDCRPCFRRSRTSRNGAAAGKLQDFRCCHANQCARICFEMSYLQALHSKIAMCVFGPQ
eukprot:3717367-Amphidinium_carterae.1